MKLGGVVLVLAALAGCCGDDSGGKTPDAGTPDGAIADGAVDAAIDAGCVKRWTKQLTVPGANASATVSGGALIVRSTNTAAGSPLDVVQSGLSGDFDATFTFEAFVAGGTGGLVQAGVSAGPTNVAIAGIGSFPTVGISAAFVQPAGGPSDIKASTGTAGTMRIQRTGSNLTVTTIAGGVTATATRTFTTGDLNIGVQIGSNMGTVASEISIRITDFAITGGGSAVKSDDFSCDSLR